MFRVFFQFSNIFTVLSTKCSHFIYAQRSKLRPFWSPWRVEKYLATKILAKVANWRPTDLKRNLIEKLSKIPDEFNQ